MAPDSASCETTVASSLARSSAQYTSTASAAISTAPSSAQTVPVASSSTTVASLIPRQSESSSNHPISGADSSNSSTCITGANTSAAGPSSIHCTDTDAPAQFSPQLAASVFPTFYASQRSAPLIEEDPLVPISHAFEPTGSSASVNIAHLQQQPQMLYVNRRESVGGELYLEGRHRRAADLLQNLQLSSGRSRRPAEPSCMENRNRSRSSAALQSGGLPREIWRLLPEEVVNEQSLAQAEADAENEHRLLCMICQNDYALEEKKTRLPCIHEFHSACVKKWLEVRSSCPICRLDVLEALATSVVSRQTRKLVERLLQERADQQVLRRREEFFINQQIRGGASRSAASAVGTSAENRALVFLSLTHGLTPFREPGERERSPPTVEMTAEFSEVTQQSARLPMNERRRRRAGNEGVTLVHANRSLPGGTLSRVWHQRRQGDGGLQTRDSVSLFAGERVRGTTCDGALSRALAPSTPSQRADCLLPQSQPGMGLVDVTGPGIGRANMRRRSGLRELTAVRGGERNSYERGSSACSGERGIGLTEPQETRHQPRSSLASTRACSGIYAPTGVLEQSHCRPQNAVQSSLNRNAPISGSWRVVTSGPSVLLSENRRSTVLSSGSGTIGAPAGCWHPQQLRRTDEGNRIAVNLNPQRARRSSLVVASRQQPIAEHLEWARPLYRRSNSSRTLSTNQSVAVQLTGSPQQQSSGAQAETEHIRRMTDRGVDSCSPDLKRESVSTDVEVQTSPSSQSLLCLSRSVEGEGIPATTSSVVDSTEGATEGSKRHFAACERRPLRRFTQQSPNAASVLKRRPCPRLRGKDTSVAGHAPLSKTNHRLKTTNTLKHQKSGLVVTPKLCYVTPQSARAVRIKQRIRTSRASAGGGTCKPTRNVLPGKERLLQQRKNYAATGSEIEATARTHVPRRLEARNLARLDEEISALNGRVAALLKEEDPTQSVNLSSTACVPSPTKQAAWDVATVLANEAQSRIKIGGAQSEKQTLPCDTERQQKAPVETYMQTTDVTPEPPARKLNSETMQALASRLTTIMTSTVAGQAPAPLH